MTDSFGRSSCALFTGTAWYYARYRPGYPEAFFADLVGRFASMAQGDFSTWAAAPAS